jgi:hypothetical protein
VGFSAVFQKQMFVDAGKRWLRALWNCELRGDLAAGFLVRGFGNNLRTSDLAKQDSEQLL